MRLITVEDVITWPDRSNVSKYHILTAMSIFEFVEHYAAKMAATNARFASQKMGGYFTILNVLEVGNPEPEEVRSLSSKHFSGYVLKWDGTEVPFDSYK
jgi:hypothetical protein